jgi:ABC-2 type transport system permease protein
MFWHNYKYAFKTLLKNKALVFWTLAFPFILAVLFNLAFARLHDYDTFEPFDVAVVEDDAFKKNLVFRSAFNTLSEGDEQLFKTQYVSMDEAEKLLDDEKIEGFVYIADDEAHVKIKANGTNQTVLKTVTEQISQTATMVEDIAKSEMERQAGQKVNTLEIYMNAVKLVTESEPNIKEDSHVMNMVVIEFYTLIAMACMQGAMLSVELTNRCLPNLSNRGKRVAIAPTRKGTMLISSLLAGYTMLFFSLIALITFMRFILGVEFGSNIGLIMLLSAVGALAAMMLGVLLSVTFKTNESAKNVIVVIVTMVGCLFAGMFGGMKIIFDEMCPWFNKISPVGMITDGYYSLYYYDDPQRYFVNLLSLLAVSAIFFVLAVRNLRKAHYDSI